MRDRCSHYVGMGTDDDGPLAAHLGNGGHTAAAHSASGLGLSCLGDE